MTPSIVVGEVLRIGSQILLSLLATGSVEVWLSEFTEEHFMQYSWLHKEEYLKRQVHVALALISIIAMMSACRISGTVQTLFISLETPQTVSAPTTVRQRERLPIIKMFSDTTREQNQRGNIPHSSMRALLLTIADETPSVLREVSFTLLQGTLTSIGSPLLVFIVYSVAIAAKCGRRLEYRTEEHLRLYSVADLIITANYATILSVLVVSSLLHLLVVVTRALGLDPDILVVPLASAAGHFAYLFFFDTVHEANCRVRLIIFICQLLFLAVYWMKGISAQSPFPFWELLPAAAISITLSTQYALIDSAVYEMYPKVNLLFSLTGFVAVIHASAISSSFRIATARCIPYTRPALLTSTFLGDGPELERVFLSIACVPGLGLLSMLHSHLLGTSLAIKPVLLSLCFAILWLLILLLVARWSNHLLRHIYGKHARPGCCTIAILEFIQHLAQSIVYFNLLPNITTELTTLLPNFTETIHALDGSFNESTVLNEGINITRLLLYSQQERS